MALRNKLTSEQQKVVAAIRAGARRNNATPKEEKAALETGLVESNLQNLSGGDADSAGWRQERASLYKDPTNLHASVDRFFQETKAVRGKYATAGALAAAVQRPAAQFRGRYQERSAEAEALLGASGGAGAPVAADATQAAPPVEPEPATAVPPASILPQVQSAGIAAPSFSAQATLPRGYATVMPSSGAPSSLADRLTAGITAVDPTQPQPDTVPVPAPETSSGLGARVHDGVASPERGKLGKVIGVPYAGTHTLGNWQSDNAVDIAMPTGTILQSLEDGVVEKVKGSYNGGSSRFDGYQVTIRFKNGNRAFYTHLSKAGVKAGQRIRAGQAIGRSGAANGVEHLHLGVEKGDPRTLIARGRK